MGLENNFNKPTHEGYREVLQENENGDLDLNQDLLNKIQQHEDLISKLEENTEEISAIQEELSKPDLPEPLRRLFNKLLKERFDIDETITIEGNQTRH